MSMGWLDEPVRELENDAEMFADAASFPDRSIAEADTEIENGNSVAVVPDGVTKTVIVLSALPPPLGRPEKIPELL
jgi:hypothetical protein